MTDDTGTTPIPKIDFLHKSDHSPNSDEGENFHCGDSVSSSESDSDDYSPNQFASSSFSGKILHLWGKREKDVV